MNDQPDDNQDSHEPGENPQKPEGLTAVVGIGASAGGLEALESVLGTAPANSGFAYVVVTHLSPNFKSLMDELLSQHTPMPVQQVEDGMEIQANQVYVISPNTEMIVVAGRLLLSDRDPGNQIALPIDTFFRSLAREYGKRAIAVVLSGTGGDGSHALSAIRDVGGKVIVQDPDTAKFDGMPRAAMATGVADLVLSPTRIGEALSQMDPRHSQMLIGKPEGIDDPEQDALERIFAAVFGTSSVNFEAYKTTTVLRRINRRIVARRLPTIAAYADLIEEDREEAASLNRDMLIGVTRFFRDTESFEQLDDLVLSELAREAGPERPIRIWVPACATGEEAYSIAMLMQRQYDRLGIEGNTQIFATDLQREFVETAGRGVFSPDTFPAEWNELKEAYTRPTEDGMMAMEPHIRRMVVFAHHNVMTDPPFTRLDLVSCRNMLIYLQPDAQEQVLSLMTFGVRRSGFLFLGPSESLGATESSFTVLSKRWRIYRKERDLTAFHVPERRGPRDNEGPKHRPSGIRRTPAPRREVDMMPAYTVMLERFAPPSILIDGERQLLHIFGSARDHLRPPSGLVSLDLLDMVPEWLRLPLATAIDRVNREGQEIRYSGTSPDNAPYDVSVVPLAGASESRRGFKLVLLEQTGPVQPLVDVQAMVQMLDSDTVSEARIQDLEGELRHTKENLQATIEEVETSNEELQSTNEELMAANEELQSTNEELHSVNEELYSVNAEYQRKNDELIQLNRDMEALMASTDVGVIFVDDRLAIRRFTSPAKRIFNLIDEDQGRSLTHLTHTLVDADVVSIARRAVDQFLSSEHKFQSEDGTWWLVRCMPMKTPGSNAIGAIITAVDIDEVQKGQVQIEKDRWRMNLISEIGRSLVVTSDIEMNINEKVDGWERFTGQKFDEYSAKGWIKAVHPDDADDMAQRGKPSANEAGGFQTSFRLWHADSKEFRQVQAHVVAEHDAHGLQVGWTGIVVDVDEAFEAHRQLGATQALIEAVGNDLPGMICLLGKDWCYQFVNQAYQNRWGADASLVGELIDDVLPAEILDDLKPRAQRAFDGEPQQFFTERQIGDHAKESLLVVFTPRLSLTGDVHGISVWLYDVSETIAYVRDQDLSDGNFGRALMDGDGEYLVIENTSQAIVQASRGAATNLRRGAADLVRLKLHDILPEFDDERLKPHLTPRADRRGTSFNTFVLRGDGSSYDASVQIENHHADLQDRSIVTITNVSEANATQKVLRRRNEELARSNSDLENFAHFASHDLQEPARKIGNFAGLVEEDLGDLANEDTREYLGIIRRASERMLTLVQDLLTFSRVRTEEERFGEVDLEDVLQEIAEDRSIELNEVGGSLTIGKMPTLQGDRALLSQLFGNLVGNAIKYRDPDRKLEVDVSCVTENGEHVFTVTDNGIGFANSDADQIFGLFQRLHSPTGIPGTGVGLAICKRVSELHGGDIQADGSAGEGARFTVTLPVQRPA